MRSCQLLDAAILLTQTNNTANREFHYMLTTGNSHCKGTLVCVERAFHAYIYMHANIRLIIGDVIYISSEDSTAVFVGAAILRFPKHRRLLNIISNRERCISKHRNRSA